MSELTVAHLVSASYDSSPVHQFAQAYRMRAAGLDHRLVILLSGFEADGDSAHLTALSGLTFDTMRVPASTIDLNAYLYAAERLSPGPVCFLNSHSEPLVDGWLSKLHLASRSPGVGLVGATGSWESMSIRGSLRRWPRFPNAHLRTNAFIIDRDLMLSLRWPRVVDKRHAWQIESGQRGLTRQVRGRGLGVLVVGRDGSYPPSEWAFSRTFRSGAQENLLVADNRTRQYLNADPETQRMLATLAWGPAGTG